MRWSRAVLNMLCGLLFLTGLHGQVCWAATDPGKAAGDSAGQAPKSGWQTAMDGFHHPTDWLDMGADFRARDEYGENIYTVDNSGAYNYTNWMRYRSRVWAKIKPDKDLDFNFRVLDEFRTWTKVSKASQAKDMDWDEVIFDNFNVTARNLAGMPVTGVFGRQDIMLGENWLVMDGTPLDGSRTQFLDAARFTVDWKEQNTKVDFIYVDMGAPSDRWLTPFGDRHRNLSEQNEHGAIFYLTHKPSSTMQVEAYFMYRSDDRPSGTSSNMPPTWSQEAELSTLGGAVAGQMGQHWSYRVEGAAQTGQRNDRDLMAFATNNRLNYAFKDDYQNALRAGYEYVSGDNPDTAGDERFDMLWGEWPRWSELYIYTYSKEGTVAENSNLHRFDLGHTFWPDKKVQVQTDYMALWADQSRSDLGPGKGFSTSGRFRGHLVTCWVKYTLTPQIKGHLLAEYLWPGDYYTVQDNAAWLRFQVEYTF